MPPGMRWSMAAAACLAAVLLNVAAAKPPANAADLGLATPATPRPGDAAAPGECPFGNGARDHRAPGGWSTMLEALHLSGEQRQAAQAVLERYRARSWDLAQRGKGIREQLMSVAPDAPGYADAVEAASQAAAALAADGVKLLSDMRAELYGILTKEQRSQLQLKAQQQRDRWAEWRSRHQAPQQ